MEDDFNEYDDNLKSEDIDDDQYTYFDESDIKEDDYDVDYDYFNDYHNYDADDTIYRNEINYTNDKYDDEKDDEKEEEEKSFRSKLLKPIIAILVIIVILCIITICSTKLNKPKKSPTKGTDVTVISKKKEMNFDEMFLKVKNASLKFFDEERLKQATVVELKTLNTVQLLDDINGYNDEKSVAKLIKDSTSNNYQLTIELVKDNVKKTKTYNISNYKYCTETYLCEKQNDNENIKETDVDDTRKYLYEYVKEEKKSSWSTWTNGIETSCDTKTITCNDDTCNKEVEVTKKNVQLASEKKIYISSRSAFKTNGKEIKQVCRNYDYIKINGIYYRTESNSDFKDIGLIKKTTQSNYNNWIYRGRSSFKNPPNDTLTVRYVFVKADYSKCGDTCSDGPNYYYDMYTFRYGLNYSANPQSDCNNLIQKGIPDYSINPQQISVARLEKKYTTVCYKKERTKINSTGVKENKWSTYNDENLLNSGYIYSGNKKEK